MSYSGRFCPEQDWECSHEPVFQETRWTVVAIAGGGGTTSGWHSWIGGRTCGHSPLTGMRKPVSFPFLIQKVGFVPGGVWERPSKSARRSIVSVQWSF